MVLEDSEDFQVFACAAASFKFEFTLCTLKARSSYEPYLRSRLARLIADLFHPRALCFICSTNLVDFMEVLVWQHA